MMPPATASAVLEAEVQRYIHIGYYVTARTDTAVQLRRPKQFDAYLAILGLLFLGVGLVVYLLVYMGRRDDLVYLAVNDDGTVTMIGAALSQPAAGPFLRQPDDRWTCAHCSRHNAAQYFECLQCGVPRPTA